MITSLLLIEIVSRNCIIKLDLLGVKQQRSYHKKSTARRTSAVRQHNKKVINNSPTSTERGISHKLSIIFSAIFCRPKESLFWERYYVSFNPRRLFLDTSGTGWVFSSPPVVAFSNSLLLRASFCGDVKYYGRKIMVSHPDGWPLDATRAKRQTRNLNRALCAYQGFSGAARDGLLKHTLICVTWTDAE